MVTSGQSLLQISQFLYGKSNKFNSWQSYSCQLANGLFSPAIFSRLLRKLIWETERGNSLNISLLKCRNARGDRNGRFDETLSNRVVVHGFDDFDELQSNSSERNHLGGFNDFDEFSPFLLLHAFQDFFRKLKWTRAKSDINPKLF